MLKYRSNSITGLRLEQLWLIIGLWGQNNTFLTRGMRLMLDMSSQQVEPGGCIHSFNPISYKWLQECSSRR